MATKQEWERWAPGTLVRAEVLGEPYGLVVAGNGEPGRKVVSQWGAEISLEVESNEVTLSHWHEVKVPIEDPLETISYEEIQVGDTIRVEWKDGDVIRTKLGVVDHRTDRGFFSKLGLPLLRQDEWKPENIYLIHRPEKPFTPVRGMAVGDPRNNAYRVVYLPNNDYDDGIPWLGRIPDSTDHWHHTDTVKDLIENKGWEVIE